MIDTDDDGDGILDGDDKEPKVKDTTKPVITPIANQTVVEGNAIVDVTLVATDNEGVNRFEVTGLPAGVNHDQTTNVISGTPTVTWTGDTHEEETVTVTVKAIDHAGNFAETTFNITVQRDTDGDGNPDVTDTDDDGDGILDDVDKEPKVKDTTPPVIAPIANQTVVEGRAITRITAVATDNEGEVRVKVTGLPAGVNHDEVTNVISGTPTAVWKGDTHEEETVTVTVTATDKVGNVATRTFDIKVQRDTDRDGLPDILDPDDDGDGVLDGVDKQPKIKDRIRPVITPIENQTVVEGKEITPVIVDATDNEGVDWIRVFGLPDGVTFNSTTNTFSGIPKVTWRGDTHEEETITLFVKAADASGNESAITSFNITVQRDTATRRACAGWRLRTPMAMVFQMMRIKNQKLKTSPVR